MKIKVHLRVGEDMVLEDILIIDDHKLEELTVEEQEQAIEIHISEWANRNVHIAWEAIEADQEE